MGEKKKKTTSQSCCSVQEALAALDDVLEAWPLENQDALFARQMVEHLKAVTPAATLEMLAQCWRAMRPYTLPGKDAERDKKFNCRDPILAAVGLSVQAKAQRFKELIYLDVLLPLVMGGENKSYTLRWWCESLEVLTGQDLLQDIEDDEYVSVLTELQVHVKALQGLVAADVAVKIQHKDAIEELRSLRLDATRAPDAVVASALSDVPYWKQKLGAWSTLMKTLSVQKVKLEDLASFSRGASLPDIKVLGQKLADFTVLSEELPSDSVQALSSSPWTKVELMWDEFVGENGAEKISMSSMQELLKEVDLAWPLSEQVKSWQTELAALMVQATGSQRLVTMIAALTSLPTSKEGLHKLDKHKQLDPALRLAREAAGVKLSVDQKQTLEKWWATTMGAVETHLGEMELDHLRILGDVFKAVMEWFPAEPAMAGQLRNLNGIHDLSLRFRKYIGDVSSSTAKDWVAADADRQKLASFMRSFEAA